MRGTQAKRLRAQARTLCNPNATGYRAKVHSRQMVDKRGQVVLIADGDVTVFCAPGGFRATYQKMKREFKR